MKATNHRSSITDHGFTLIELLVVLSIMAILIGLTLFGIGGARESARDGKRKADLELIRSGIEVYKADCNIYPLGNGDPASVLASPGTNSLVGDGLTASCLSTNTYIGQIPVDPRSPNSVYRYFSDGYVYEVCAALEQDKDSGKVATCNGVNNVCGETCTYKVTNP